MLKHYLHSNEKVTTHISSPPKFIVAKNQKSIKKDITITGIGLHTGNNVTMTL